MVYFCCFMIGGIMGAITMGLCAASGREDEARVKEGSQYEESGGVLRSNSGESYCESEKRGTEA